MFEWRQNVQAYVCKCHWRHSEDIPHLPSTTIFDQIHMNISRIEHIYLLDYGDEKTKKVNAEEKKLEHNDFNKNSPYRNDNSKNNRKTEIFRRATFRHMQMLKLKKVPAFYFYFILYIFILGARYWKELSCVRKLNRHCRDLQCYWFYLQNLRAIKKQ